MMKILFARRDTPSPLTERLGDLAGSLPVRDTVLIHWDSHQIPFIEARADEDLAVALGAVHAHLRLGQMEFMRRLALGRVSETIGPLGLGIDKTLLMLDFGRAVPAMIQQLAEPTRRWAEGFVRGVNHQIAHGPVPRELRLLGVSAAPWTLTDLLTVARLASADVSWLVWSRLLRARRRLGQEAWAELWPDLLSGGVPEPAEGGTSDDDATATLRVATRDGSNAAAVAARRSASGGAMLVADPHLSVALPNIWLIAGFSSPGYNAVGLMPAGLPIVAIGRNPWIAWGGTSLHAASSDLFDARGMKISERVVSIPVRGGRNRDLRIRECELGPIVSDGLILPNAEPLALRWVGHAPSDEMGAMLGVMRARGAEEFRAALSRFAVPAQNMLHAGRDGRIGHLLAASLPRREPRLPSDLIEPPASAAAWQRMAGTTDLPHWLDPAPGFAASANDRPPDGSVPIGYFFSPPNRVDRMRALLGGDALVSAGDLARLPLDVLSDGSLAVRDALLARLKPTELAHPVVRAIAAWDGAYTSGSAPALAYEVLLAHLVRRLGRSPRRSSLSAVWTGRAMLLREIMSTPDAEFRIALRRALPRTAATMRRLKTWGGAHRLVLRHQFALLPVVGRRYRFGILPADGSNDTLNKTGHRLATGRHEVQYGASARFVADMSEPDANRAVLLGGQDGWLGSDTFLDQMPLWQRGDYIDVPLRPETARAWPHHTVHPPLSANGAG